MVLFGIDTDGIFKFVLVQLILTYMQTQWRNIKSDSFDVTASVFQLMWMYLNYLLIIYL